MNHFFNKLVLVVVTICSGLAYAGDGPGAFDPPTTPIDSYLPFAVIVALVMIVLFRKKIVTAIK